MTNDEILVRGVTFEPDGSVVVEYCLAGQDLKANGVVHNHALRIPLGADYDDEIDEVEHAVKAIIKDVLEDLPDLDPYAYRTEDDEDDE